MKNKIFACKVLAELNRKLLLLVGEKNKAIRTKIVDSILEENEGASITRQGEEKQLKMLLDIDTR